jgi:hypothetical protein
MRPLISLRHRSSGTDDVTLRLQPLNLHSGAVTRHLGGGGTAALHLRAVVADANDRVGDKLSDMAATG